MMETEIIIFCVFCAAAAAFLKIILLREKEKTEETKTEEPVFFKEEDFVLRNGYGVTRHKNPTFAEQWVNIMNYNGESQLEEDYEEENINSAEYLGRVS